jgi:hypothetical protein
VFFTPRDDLSLDVGVKRAHAVLKHTNRLARIVPNGNGIAVVVEGPVEDQLHLEVRSRQLGRTRVASSALESINQVTHVAEVPLRLRPGGYRFALSGSSGPRPLLPGERAAPQGWRLTHSPNGQIMIEKEGLIANAVWSANRFAIGFVRRLSSRLS